MVPEPVPGFDRTYDDTYRILASDDADPLYNTTTIQVPEYHPDGSLTVVNRTVGTYPVRLSTGNLHPTDALTTAYSTDVYSTSLLDRAGTVPYQDTWETLARFNASGRGMRTRVYPLQNVSFGTPTSTDGAFRAEVLTTNGDWYPIYNADIQPDTSVDGYSVANPGSALVHIPKGEFVTQRKVDALRSLLRHSELASSKAAARSTAVIPMENGTELYPTHSGAVTNLYWRSGGFALVMDAYISVSDMPPGVWYDGRYVTRSTDTTAYVPWDYRVEAPTPYTNRTVCRHTHRSGNTTWTEVHPRTQWADYRILDTEATVTVTMRNATATQRMYRLGGPGGIWSTYDDRTGTHHPLAPGNYTVVAELSVDAVLERQYGVRSAECHEWDVTDTETRSTTVTYSAPVRLIERDSPGLTIDATLFDKPGNDVLALEWTGNQGLTGSPWQDITVTVGEKRFHVVSPWRFYSVSQNDAVEERTSAGATAVAAGHSYDDRYPRFLRNRVSVANVTTRLVETAHARSWWREDHEVIAQSVPGTSLPSTIVAPDNAGPTYLYREYGGVILSTDDAVGEGVSIDARTPFGADVDTSIDVVVYEDSNLDIWVANGSTAQVVVHLTDPKTGAPIPGREIELRGASTNSVVTNSSGMASAIPVGTNVMATFEGDDWRGSRSTYYLGDSEGIVTGYGVINDFTDVFGYLTMGVSNLVLIIEWIALGLFALWWVRNRGQHDSGR